jgi:hypothetical protein
VLVVRLGNECERLSRVERRIVECVRAVRNTGDRNDADARIGPADRLTRRCVTQEVTGLAALEPEA